jgi:hypothetical protein
MSADRAAALRPLLLDLQRIFGERLEALVGYGWRRQTPIPSLALVTSLTFEDLGACAERAAAWRRMDVATPLLLTRAEFARSLDAFPIEFGEIIAAHDVAFGADPFAGLTIRPEDLRRACEVQVKSHLLHLREDFIESGGRRDHVEALVRESAAAFLALLRQLAQLDARSAISTRDLVAYARDRVGLEPHVVDDLLGLADADTAGAVDAIKLFPRYLAAMERLAVFVDQWRAS